MATTKLPLATNTHHDQQRAPLAARSTARAEGDDEEDAAEDEEEDADVVDEGQFRHFVQLWDPQSCPCAVIHEVEIAQLWNDELANEELEDDPGGDKC